MTTNIYIKSFNRPYFLDRCLYSIYRYMTGNYRVIILDDGTPLKYIDRVKEKYPQVIFQFSDDAVKKRTEIEQAIRTGEEHYTRSIPLQFWHDTVEQGSGYFLLTEDDIWVTAPVDVDAYVQLMKAKKMNTIKLRWWGNENTNVGERVLLSGEVEAVIPKIHFAAEWIVKNRFYIHAVLSRLKLIKGTFFQQLYTYYEVGGVFFDKRYWLFLYSGRLDSRVEEMVQLGKAAEWARKHPETMFGKCITEAGRSTYLTSAAGGYNGQTGFSMTMVNHYLNDEWYRGKFDSMQNFPEDYALDTVYDILQKSGDPKCDPEKWKKWSRDFQAHFVRIGASPKG
ncbi:MAG: hypothetical protein QM610_03365 [Chitinophagaceae bacterium]